MNEEDRSICPKAADKKHAFHLPVPFRESGATWFADMVCTLCGAEGTVRIKPEDLRWG